jgi:hypothetical protein
MSSGPSINGQAVACRADDQGGTEIHKKLFHHDLLSSFRKIDLTPQGTCSMFASSISFAQLYTEDVARCQGVARP